MCEELPSLRVYYGRYSMETAPLEVLFAMDMCNPSPDRRILQAISSKRDEPAKEPHKCVWGFHRGCTRRR